MEGCRFDSRPATFPFFRLLKWESESGFLSSDNKVNKVQKIVWGLMCFFFNDISNENYSSTYNFFFQAKKLSSIFNSFGTAKRERWRLCNFFCIWLCSCQELFFALFHCTAITIFYTDILTRKVDIAIFFRVWNGWNNCKTNCEW